MGVFAIGTGTTLSAGFFLLPGLAAEIAGPALVAAYLLAALPLVPAMFTIVELATAMPRAGGVYYFLDRSLGPMVGTIGGLGTWIALTLKVAFALVGIGAYAGLFVAELPVTPVAVGLAVVLGAVNAFGAKATGRFQVVLVAGLLAILGAFLGERPRRARPGALPPLLPAPGWAGCWRPPASSTSATSGSPRWRACPRRSATRSATCRAASSSPWAPRSPSTPWARW